MIYRTTDWVVAAIITCIYRVLSTTWCVTYRGTLLHDQTPPPRIYAHWHGDELLLIGAHANRHHAVLSSLSRDGSRMAKILKWLGYIVIRGSSTRGGAGGLKGLINVVKRNGSDASLACDGPHGPIHQVKLGVLKLAQLSGAPLVPGVAAAKSRYVFKRTWNHCYLPMPFTQCLVLYGDPIFVPRDISEEAMELLRDQFQSSLIELKSQAEMEMGEVGRCHSLLESS